MDLDALAKELDACQACALWQDAIGPVGWFGNPDSPIVFVGEGPRDRVLTTNVIKCRPKNNRTPDIAEAAFCAKRWLTRELEIIQPKVIVALGGVAMHYLGNPDMRITRDRGQWFRTEQGFDCIATYHPAYLLRLTGHALVTAKWDVFHDLEAARERAALLAPGYEFMSPEKVDLFKIFKKRVHDYL